MAFAIPGLTSLTGGGSLAPSASAKSGDASAGLSNGDFFNNAAFSVGGSGSSGSGENPKLVYALVILVAVAIIAPRFSRRSP